VATGVLNVFSSLGYWWFIHHSAKGVVLDMILTIIMVLAILAITIVYVLKGIYINKFNLEGSLKGFKLSFETKIRKDPPSSKK
jgi:hypothetical protein